MKSINPSWWLPTPPLNTPDPISAIQTAINCLKSGEPVPEPAATVLHDGLQRFMTGTRFEQALGLQGQPGKPTPVQEAAREWRDTMIRELADHLPGERCRAKAEAVMGMLQAPVQPVEPGRYVSQADAIAYELQTREQYGLDLPTSLRQYQRVIGGK